MTRKIRQCVIAAASAGFVTVVLWTSMISAAPAAKKPGKKPKKQPHAVYLTVEKAGPDYKVQGEYVGTAGGKKIGVQVIALGKGAFQAVFLPGGLPGAGWDGKTRHAVDGGTSGAVTTFAPSKAKKRYMGNSPEEFSALKINPAEGQPNYAATIRGGVLTGKAPCGEAITAKRVVRTSPTLGAKPSAGAKVLFDGTNADQWINAKIDDRKLLLSNAETKATFGSFTLHLEFITPFKPTARGQDRGNSGVYLQRRYEVQVLDSFGLSGEANECGGLYRQKPPSPNMAFPPLTWQTYDIDFAAAKFVGGKRVANAVITVRHNGVVIHNDYPLRNKTGAGRKEGSEGGPIWLQGHSNPVYYRNVWIVARQ